MRTGRPAARTTLIPAPQDELCLTFANTRFWRGSPMPSESLGGIEDLLHWLAHTAKVPAESIEAARNRLRRHRNDAGLFADAIALREAIYRTFSALAASEPVAEKDLALLNRKLAEAPHRETLAQGEDGYAWDVKTIDASAAGFLAPVLWSAADLLTHAPPPRVRRWD